MGRVVTNTKWAMTKDTLKYLTALSVHQNMALQLQMSGALTNLPGTPLYCMLWQSVSSLWGVNLGTSELPGDLVNRRALTLCSGVSRHPLHSSSGDSQSDIVAGQEILSTNRIVKEWTLGSCLL